MDHTSEPLRQRVAAAIGDHYALGDEIGRGGMSVVYRARDLRLNRAVAIKVLPPELAYDPAIRTRFTREAQTSAQLAHAHIVPIYDVGERDGIAWFVMGIVTGGNLAELLERQPRQPVDDVRRILCEVSDALAYAHLRGVIHRDIKPDNILLDGESGRAMVTDFGIAHAIEGGTRLTVTGNAVGTPTYMSPEQALGERDLDGRSDIYSLGVVAYQMLTGRVPFAAPTAMALLLKHVSERPRPIAELRPETPRALAEAVEHALVKSAEDRWPTASALREALMSSEQPSSAARRADQREPVRYVSPRPQSARIEKRPLSPRRGTPVAAVEPLPRARGEIVMEPEHLAALTPEQRADLRLWHGRVNLLDRVKAMRGYAALTVVSTVGSVLAFVAAVDAGYVPFVIAPIVPVVMCVKLWKRGRSLRESGLKLRRVLNMPSARMAFPAPPPVMTDKRLEKLVPREILDGPQGAIIRRAAEDRDAIVAIAASLSKSDRALVPELGKTVNALLDRVAQLAQMLHRLDQSIDPRQGGELDARLAVLGVDGNSPDDERRVALLRRQRDTIQQLAQRRTSLARQLDSAGLALGNLRLDLIKLRSSALQSAMSDVTSATQEVRALSRDIDAMLDAVAEVRGI